MNHNLQSIICKIVNIPKIIGNFTTCKKNITFLWVSLLKFLDSQNLNCCLPKRGGKTGLYSPPWILSDEWRNESLSKIIHRVICLDYGTGLWWRMEGKPKVALHVVCWRSGIDAVLLFALNIFFAMDVVVVACFFMWNEVVMMWSCFLFCFKKNVFCDCIFSFVLMKCINPENTRFSELLNT